MTGLDRRSFLKCSAAGTLGYMAGAWARPATAREEAPRKKPNFVFFLIDDMGWRDAGCFGSTFYETPNIDRLAREGMRFTDAYAACPVCSPTRASIMTGKNPARLHLTNFLVGQRWPKDSPLVNIPDWQKFLPLEEVTIAEALKEAGYATGYVGKWHLGNTPYTPEAQGFDFNKGGCHMGAPKTYFDPYSIPNLPDRKKGEYLTDRLADEAIRFIEAHRDAPFFLYFAHYAVHVPLQAKDDRTAKYAAKAGAMAATDVPEFGQEGRNRVRQVQNHPVYAGMVESVDDSVGRVMKKLADLGLDDNTIIFFFSDNGGLSTAEGWPTSNLPLRAGKGWLYEGGVREPMIVRAPGFTRPGSACTEPVISTDFYPTMLELSGLPLRPTQHVDGVSFVSLLKGEKMTRGPIYWHYPHYSNQGGAPAGAIRQGDWKLVEWYEDNRVELYNLADDPGERNDLAGDKPEKAKELLGLLEDWRRSVSAQMPTRKEPTRPGGKG